jgi:hypothetical protein
MSALRTSWLWVGLRPVEGDPLAPPSLLR